MYSPREFVDKRSRVARGSVLSMKLLTRLTDRPGQDRRRAAWPRMPARVPGERERAPETAIAGPVSEGALYTPKISRNAVGPKHHAVAISTTTPPDDLQKIDMPHPLEVDDADRPRPAPLDPRIRRRVGTRRPGRARRGDRPRGARLRMAGAEGDPTHADRCDVALPVPRARGARDQGGIVDGARAENCRRGVDLLPRARSDGGDQTHQGALAMRIIIENVTTGKDAIRDLPNAREDLQITRVDFRIDEIDQPITIPIMLVRGQRYGDQFSIEFDDAEIVPRARRELSVLLRDLSAETAQWLPPEDRSA